MSKVGTVTVVVLVYYGLNRFMMLKKDTGEMSVSKITESRSAENFSVSHIDIIKKQHVINCMCLKQFSGFSFIGNTQKEKKKPICFYICRKINIIGTSTPA